jgi:hypothetical protein
MAVRVIGALRAQTRVWGGQSNLPVPLDEGTFEHPALWALPRALDPDAVMVHSTAWLDLEDLRPERYAEYRQQTDAELRRHRRVRRAAVRQAPADEVPQHGDAGPGSTPRDRALGGNAAARTTYERPVWASIGRERGVLRGRLALKASACRRFRGSG